MGIPKKPLTPKEAIKAMGYKTQRAAAEAAGFHYVPFNLYINGKRRPDTKNFLKLTRFFGGLVSQESFLG